MKQLRAVQVLARWVSTDALTGDPDGLVIYVVKPSGSDPEATDPYHVEFQDGIFIRCRCKGFLYTDKPDEEIKGHCYHGTALQAHEDALARTRAVRAQSVHEETPAAPMKTDVLSSLRPPHMDAGIPMR